MWKIAFVAFLVSGPGLAGAARLTRSEDGVPGCPPGEECPESGGCAPGEVHVGEMCYKMATESQNECEIQEQCSGINGSICSTGICVGQAGLGDACSTTLECDPTRNLTCESGVCGCPAGTTESGENCVKDVNPCGNGTCPGNETSPCAAGTDGDCRCREGFVLSEDGESCLKEAEELGEECETARQCERVNGTCEDGTCKFLLPPSVVVPALASPALIATECASDGDCSHVKHAICKESICQCRDDFFQSEDQDKCLPFASKAGDPCQMDKQCSRISTSTCIDGKCAVVAAAGVKTRKNGSRSSLRASAAVVAFVVAGSRTALAW